MPKLAFTLTRIAPAAYSRLLWDIFFAQRDRGVDIGFHFPWLGGPDDARWFGLMCSGSDVVAGLVVKEMAGGGATQGAGRLALIGLVCVAATHRGVGVSTRLLDHTLRELEAMGFDAATLWTSKPAVYAKFGFDFADRARLGWIEHRPASSADMPDLRITRWPDAAEAGSANRGVPPFAYYAQRVSCRRRAVSVIMTFDAQSMVVAEWQGPEEAVADLLVAVMPPRWRLNALQDDLLPEVLRGRGLVLDLKPQRLQMWKAIGTRPVSLNLMADCPLRLLDRI